MSDFLTKKEFETWKNNLEKRINLDMIKGEIPNHFENFEDYVQRETQNFNSAGVAVVFDTEYSEVPEVVVSSGDTNFYATRESITTLGFTGRVRKYDGTNGTISCSWVAIGKV